MQMGGLGSPFVGCGTTHLGELELGQVELLHAVPQHIGRREEPTAARALLARDRVCLEVELEIEDVGVGDAGGAGDEGLADVGVVEDGTRELELGRLGDVALPGIDVAKDECTVLGERGGNMDVGDGLVEGLLGVVRVDLRSGVGGLGRVGSPDIRKSLLSQ